jgi:hypothetical protein
VTYPDHDVAQYIGACFVPLKLLLGNPEQRQLYRANRIIWTPTVGFMDRNGSMHYHSPGFLPPVEFISVLRIGRARCLMAWTRSAEAAQELESAAASDNSFSAEALYWLGVAHYLERRETPGMWTAWERLVSLYPDSPWAKRVYPR